jgi:hypothetical protein
MSNLAESEEKPWGWKSFRGGIELGLWKGMGEFDIVSTCILIVKYYGETRWANL